jgi:hypothetical protein
MAGRARREDAMKLMPCSILMFLFVAGVASAQTLNDLQIQVGAYNVSDNGGEKPVGVWLSTGPLVIGRPATGTFSIGETCDAFAVSSDGSLTENATTAWRVEVTPIRVVRDAVTFRLRWVRFAGLRQQLDRIPLDATKDFRVPNEDIELTLRPGESWPMDSVPVPSGAKTVEGRACRGSASVRALVNHHPWEEDERRLVVADLWLIERLSNGTEAERSQSLAVRGLPNRPFRFYFDSIVDSSAWLDIYGILIARPESGAMAVSVETRSRWGDPSNPPKFSGPGRSVESVIKVNPKEIVEIRLPKLGKSAGPFADRDFSIRIRARQLRGP